MDFWSGCLLSTQWVYYIGQWRIQGGGQEAMASPFSFRHTHVQRLKEQQPRPYKQYGPSHMPMQYIPGLIRGPWSL